MIRAVSKPWTCLGTVDIAGLSEWLDEPRGGWLEQPSVDKPQRIHDPPMALVQPVIDAVLALLGDQLLAHRPMLSRMRPGQSHPMHVDAQRSDWVTRIHVPLRTSPQAWMEFEGHGMISFEVGKAYTFDTSHRHAFGNDGDSDRIHLIFDVLEAPA